MLPDFSAWLEGRRFTPGTRVRVIFPGQYFGKEATVLGYRPASRLVEITSLNSMFKAMTATVAALEVIDAP